MCTCIYIYVCIHIYIYISIYIFMYIINSLADSRQIAAG